MACHFATLDVPEALQLTRPLSAVSIGRAASGTQQPVPGLKSELQAYDLAELAGSTLIAQKNFLHESGADGWHSLSPRQPGLSHTVETATLST